MDNRKSEARTLAESAQAAAMQCRVIEQLISHILAHAPGASPATPVRTDGEKYRWIRCNRGNFAIDDAIHLSDRDKDFDDRIDVAMGAPDRCLDAPLVPAWATDEHAEQPDVAGHLRLINVDFLVVGPRSTPPARARDAGPAAIGRFDADADAVCFHVWIAGVVVHASISAAVLRAHYGHASLPMALFEKNSTALVEAVRDRVAGGSTELIALREYDLK